MAQAATASDFDHSSVLTEREIRGLQFNENYPWVPFAVVAAMWILIIGTTVYKFSVLIAHGGSFGIASWSELWNFAQGWREAQEPFHRYHLLVLETLDEAVFQLGLAFVLTIFVYILQLQNRVIRKLRDALIEPA